MADFESPFDVVGVGLNATDTVLTVEQFPAPGGKAPFTREFYSVGGQVATAMVACSRLGLRTKYIGTVGDDERGRIQMESLRTSGIDIAHVRQRVNCPNQSAYIVVDGSTGERTVFWHRPACLTISPDEIDPDQITCARLLHIDGHDTAAVEHAARIARAHGIPVTVDVDTIYPGFERVLPLVDYMIASSEFPAAWTGHRGSARSACGDSAAVGNAGCRHDSGAIWRSGIRRRPLHLFAGIRGSMHRYDGRGRRFPRRLLLFCSAANAYCRALSNSPTRWLL